MYYCTHGAVIIGVMRANQNLYPDEEGVIFWSVRVTVVGTGCPGHERGEQEQRDQRVSGAAAETWGRHRTDTSPGTSDSRRSGRSGRPRYFTAPIRTGQAVAFLPVELRTEASCHSSSFGLLNTVPRPGAPREKTESIAS